MHASIVLQQMLCGACMHARTHHCAGKKGSYQHRRMLWQMRKSRDGPHSIQAPVGAARQFACASCSSPPLRRLHPPAYPYTPPPPKNQHTCTPNGHPATTGCRLQSLVQAAHLLLERRCFLPAAGRSGGALARGRRVRRRGGGAGCSSGFLLERRDFLILVGQLLLQGFHLRHVILARVSAQAIAHSVQWPRSAVVARSATELRGVARGRRNAAMQRRNAAVCNSTCLLHVLRGGRLCALFMRGCPAAAGAICRSSSVETAVAAVAAPALPCPALPSAAVQPHPLKPAAGPTTRQVPANERCSPGRPCLPHAPWIHTYVCAADRAPAINAFPSS